MAEVRITIIECKGMDPDAEFGLVRTLSELLQRPSAAPAAAMTTRLPPCEDN